MRSVISRSAIVVLAVIAALAPLPPESVESWYTRGVYARLQPTVTATSNLVPVALLDLAVGVLLIAIAMSLLRRDRTRGLASAIGRTAWSMLLWASLLYLAFLGVWGLNYRRVPLERKLDYEPSRVTSAAALGFTSEAVTHVNSGHVRAHAMVADVAALEQAFAEAERLLGAPGHTTTGIPKRSLLSWYFRRAAIDGMTDPFFLEVIINPDLLPFERPFVLAHEWAHLAGYADEAEANFVAWLTCVRGDGLAQYSGWLLAYEHARGALSREDRRALPALDSGPRDDLRAMAARYGRSSPVVRAAARDVYDSYLRANRVAEGIASYDGVVRLMLGTRFESGWQPVKR